MNIENKFQKRQFYQQLLIWEQYISPIYEKSILILYYLHCKWVRDSYTNCKFIMYVSKTPKFNYKNDVLTPL